MTDKSSNQPHHPLHIQIIMTHTHINNEWNLLHTLLTKTCPFLGGQSIDVAAEITLLKFERQIIVDETDNDHILI